MKLDPSVNWQNEWWARGVIYEVYPRSFQDTDGDGCGDLRGVTRRLDYLSWLGVDALWLCPFYPSPMKDFGYDVADYCSVHPLFGTMADFETLLAAAHERGLRVILDLVPNHTSDQHPWFEASAQSADQEGNPRRAWYLWSDSAEDGGPPNNWISEFGGGAWEWHEPTRQYYYHAFLKEQPDLNWRHPDVRIAMYDVMRFWLDKGVDGFRVDVMWHMIKDQHLRHNPPNPNYDPEHDSPYRALLPVYSVDQPEVHAVVREMRTVIDEYPDRVLIGEVYLPIEELISYYGDEEREAHLPFNFQLIGIPWEAARVRRVVDTYEASLRPHDWPNWVLGNHDKPRLASRVGRGQARVAAILLLTLRGTPTLYYGDEIGMADVDIPRDKVRDPRELNCTGRHLGRDPARTPMQWDGTRNAGFSSAEPWLPVSPDYAACSVGVQRDDPSSLLSLYRRLLHLRKRESTLAVGDYEPLPSDPSVFAYMRRHENTAFTVLLNFSDQPQVFRASSKHLVGSVAIDSHDASADGRPSRGDRIELAANQGLVIRLDEAPAAHPASTVDVQG